MEMETKFKELETKFMELRHISRSWIKVCGFFLSSWKGNFSFFSTEVRK